MQTRPRGLLILAAFLGVVTVSFPLQIMILYGHTPDETTAIAAKLAPLNWVVIAIAAVAAVLAYRASTWLMGVLPLLIGLVCYNNFLVSQMGLDYSPALTLLGSVGFIVAVLATLNRESLQVILNPGSRWWLTPSRKRMSIPVRLKFLGRASPKKSQEGFNEFYIRTFDVSEGGAFIPLEQSGTLSGEHEKAAQAFHAILKNLAIGTQCYVCLPLKDVNFVQCRAEVVRNTQGRGEYPAGVGLRFLGLSWNERRKLQAFMDHAA